LDLEGIFYTLDMNTPLGQISKQLLALPRDSRAMLAEQLLDSLHEVDTNEVEKKWAVEAMRRLEEIRSGKVATIPGADVLAEGRRMVGR
jgi:putative addiction module component (TIGR02574 family)